MFANRRKRATSELREAAARARAAVGRPSFRDPVDRDQLRYFAEWLEWVAEGREIGAAMRRIEERAGVTVPPMMRVVGGVSDPD
jgi:hypothetical protein